MAKFKWFRKSLTPYLIAIAAALLLTACTQVPAYQQERLSQPSMTFSSSLVDAGTPALQAQLEPGVESTGDAQSSGCSACR